MRTNKNFQSVREGYTRPLLAPERKGGIHWLFMQDPDGAQRGETT